MGKTEIYSSRKKAFGILLLCLLFVTASVYMVLDAENFEHKSTLGVRVAGLLGILFFGSGMFVSLGRLVLNRLVLTIDNTGISINPRKSQSEIIEWKYIDGFSVIEIKGTKIITVVVNNANYWIEKEKNAVRKKIMKFNLDYCGTPFGISANTTRLSHAELLKIMNEHLQKHHSSLGEPA